VHHLETEEAAAQFAAHAQPAPLGHRALLGGIEVQEAQQQALPLLVAQRDQQLAAARRLDPALADHPLDLDHLAGPRVKQAHDLRLVLVAQRQVQG
jgi:hypothetical protein